MKSGSRSARVGRQPPTIITINNLDIFVDGATTRQQIQKKINT